LHRSKTDTQDAKLLHLTEAELHQKLDEARRKLLEIRSRRVWPQRDEKILTAWNALMIDALAQAAQALDRPDYAETAAKAADFLLTTMRAPNGRLFRTATVGSAPKLNAFLEDYSFLINALVSLYEATFSPRWIEAALDLGQVMIDQFWDPSGAGFFYTGRDHEQLIVRTKDPSDNAIPSGNSMAVTALLRLAKLTGRTDLHDKAEATLRLFRGLMADHPMAAAQMLIALDFHLGPVQEFVVVGDPAADETRRVLRAIRGGFHPQKVVAQKSPGFEALGIDNLLPLLHGKTALGSVTTYLCDNSMCLPPLVGAEAVESSLR